MQQFENVRLWAKMEKGKTVCVCRSTETKCHKTGKQCCDVCTVLTYKRDRFEGWQSGAHRDRYGR